MPQPATPKVYKAVADFSVAGSQFAAGDTVPHGPALAAALRFGDRFVVADTARSRKKASDTPPPDSKEA